MPNTFDNNPSTPLTFDPEVPTTNKQARAAAKYKQARTAKRARGQFGNVLAIICCVVCSILLLFLAILFLR